MAAAGETSMSLSRYVHADRQHTGKESPMSDLRKTGVVITIILSALMLTAPPVGANDGARATHEVLVPAFDSDFPVSKAPTQSETGEVTTQSAVTCTIFASDPRKEGGVIAGDGSQSCSAAVDQAITVTLQQYRGWGFWRTKAQVHAAEVTDFLARRVAWMCDGTGSGWQTYRIVTDGSFTDWDGTRYSAVVQSEHYLNVFCS